MKRHGKAKKSKKRNPKRRAAKKRTAPKRSNPRRHKARAAAPRHHRRRATKKNPARKSRRRGHARKRNPGVPGLAMTVVKAVAGGAAAAGIVAGVVAVGQKFPMTKGKAVALQAAGAVIGGGALAAIGAPGAGAVVAATLTGSAIATARSQAFAGPTDNAKAPVSGLLPHVGGLLGEHVDRNQMVSGILQKMRAGSR